MALAAAYGATLGCTGVIAGAFGSHYLRARMTEERQRSWHIAVHYQLLHAVALFACGLVHKHVLTAPKAGPASSKAAAHLNRAMVLWGAGTTVFSGSIYLLCLGYKGVLGPLTPIGGVIMIAGWASAIAAAL